MQNLKVEKSVQEYNPRYKANLYLNSILSSTFIHRYFITHTHIYIYTSNTFILSFLQRYLANFQRYKNKKIIEIMYLYVVLSLEIFETSLNLCAFTHVHVGRRVAFLNLSTMIGGHRRPIIRDLGRDGRL